MHGSIPTPLPTTSRSIISIACTYLKNLMEVALWADYYYNPFYPIYIGYTFHFVDVIICIRISRFNSSFLVYGPYFMFILVLFFRGIHRMRAEQDMLIKYSVQSKHNTVVLDIGTFDTSYIAILYVYFFVFREAVLLLYGDSD